ncbi:50S ribosomal protein L32 [Streptomyces sp. NPDC056708]|uniref:50S ribosomal protein L32 n=2 Tax=Streptomyces TaxID=1883 RepID=UPI0036C7B22E
MPQERGSLPVPLAPLAASTHGPVVGCPASSAGSHNPFTKGIAMQHRTSRSRTRHRRAHWKAGAPALTACTNPACGKATLPHRACQHCGFYRGREVLPPTGGDA